MVRRRVGAQQEGGLGGEMVRTGVARQASAAASLAKIRKKKEVTPVSLQLPLGEHLLRSVEEQPEARRGDHEVAQRGPAVRRQVEERSSGARSTFSQAQLTDDCIFLVF